MSRYWHLLPICAGIFLALFFWHWRYEQFFATDKLKFETCSSLAGLVGTFATFIEVMRASSLQGELRANIKVGMDRKKVGELARLVQMIKELVDLLAAETPISVNTTSDITGLLRALFPAGIIVNNMNAAEVEEALLKIPSLVTRQDKLDVSLFLTRIRNQVEAEIATIDTSINSLSVRSS
ncbi:MULTISPECIES: hypothetical protein [unclassified Xanthomonas]|uniref:hypothetical protein n=1 Tax=Xanthomonas sp. LMG 8992 TaxID=1591157 RepID=UPI001369AB17|nr:hypothetical protein [Xanthomonas sp. LMG 8992]